MKKIVFIISILSISSVAFAGKHPQGGGHTETWTSNDLNSFLRSNPNVSTSSMQVDFGGVFMGADAVCVTGNYLRSISKIGLGGFEGTGEATTYDYVYTSRTQYFSECRNPDSEGDCNDSDRIYSPFPSSVQVDLYTETSSEGDPANIIKSVMLTVPTCN